MHPYTIFDIEANGLYNVVTKVYCFSYKEFNSKGEEIESGTLTTYKQIGDYLNKGTTLIGHNIIRYDIPVLEKILNLKISNLLIDTLAISWYLYPYLSVHKLEKWGEKLGVEKVEIEDWEGLTLEEYMLRCEVDVEINTLLFFKQIGYLQKIYDDNSELERLLGYLTFKMDCLKEQELAGIKLDLELCMKSKKSLEELINQKVTSLTASMPSHLGNVEKIIPKVLYKKDGTLSYYGVKWFKLLEERGLSSDVKEIREAPNPNSSTQIKSWLYELGWEPRTFKVSNNTGKEVEQITLPFGKGICPSVQDLYEKEPSLEDLEGLAVARHRLSIIDGFIKHMDVSGKIYSGAHGFTNTLRLKHGSPIVNLPGVHKAWGEEIRGCLKIPNKRHIMCGSDISGLEDSTKRHYMYFFDPEYVADMSVPGFDGHIDIALFAGLMSQEEADFYLERANLKDQEIKDLPEKEYNKFKKLTRVRANAKTINFGGVYGIGPPKLARQMGISLKAAKKLHKAYWERNKAVKQTAEECITKKVNNQRWLFNPISGFWMFLKEEKDKFSTLNQSSGVYVFDTWLKEVRERFKRFNVPILMQYHDELMFTCNKHLKETVDRLLDEAMDEANKKLNLNITISIASSYGENYAECH